MAAFMRISVYSFFLLLFPMQYSMPTLLPAGFLTENTLHFPNAYICTVQNQGHNFFSYVDCTLRKGIHSFIEVSVSHCVIHVCLSTLSAVLSVMTPNGEFITLVV